MAIPDPLPAALAIARHLGIELGAGFEQRVGVYLDELERWSRVGGLTGYRSGAARVQHLVLESLLLLAVRPAVVAPPLLDIGTGPGVPGLILKLARPEWAVTLVEAQRRPCNFLRAVVRRLGLGSVTIEHTRAETLADRREFRGRFLTVTLRAVASWPEALRLASPFVGPAGRLVVPLGPDTAPDLGTVVEVRWPGEPPGLPGARRFLIIEARELTLSAVPRGMAVSRGTGGRRGARPGGGEPKGGRRQDDHRRQSGRGPRRRRAPDAPGRPGPADQRDRGRVGRPRDAAPPDDL